jgi:GNAT superfamily N-acetyltransferase
VTVELRAATAADADEVAALFSRSFRLLDFLPALHTLEEDRGYIAGVVIPGHQVTVAVDGGRIAGFLAEHEGWVNHLYVAPEALGHGIGAALLRDAQARNAELQLWCFSANARARKFYESHGFRAVEFTDGAGNEARQPDIRYRWSR